MAIDLGEKRIGIALSDPTQKMARGFTVMKRRSRKEDFTRMGNIIAEQKIIGVVMGLPLMLDGEDSQTTRWVRNYGADLATHIPVPLTFSDESFSTIEATEALRQRGVTRLDKIRDQVDSVAAAIILQRFLTRARDESPNE